MKLLLLLLLPVIGFCQGGLTVNTPILSPGIGWERMPLRAMPFLFDNGSIKTIYDTTVLFKGRPEHAHDYAKKDVKLRAYAAGTSCLVMHGPEGCSDNWIDQNEICTVCLRHINVRETRAYIPPPPPVDRYQEALDRLNKLKKE